MANRRGQRSSLNEVPGLELGFYTEELRHVTEFVIS
jgi:hypothetical protein